MGLYPVTRFFDVNTGAELTADRLPAFAAWIEQYNDFSGELRYRLIIAEEHTTIRNTCYCCSCPDHGHDAACRSHGFAATRPCEVHEQPGVVWGIEAGPVLVNTMPESVQAMQKRQRHAG